MPTFQKAWEDKKKGNMEQRKKWHMPPFLRNSSQGKQSQNEPKMLEKLGKRKRKQLIIC
jgi:hypothetical protein